MNFIMELSHGNKNNYHITHLCYCLMINKTSKTIFHFNLVNNFRQKQKLKLHLKKNGLRQKRYGLSTKVGFLVVICLSQLKATKWKQRER